MRFGGLRAGERVLIQAAAGGVGIAATQIAKLVGAEVYGTASPAKHDAIRGFGVDHPIDYRTHDVVDEVRRVAGEKHPIDVAFDAIGGRSFRQSFALLAPAAGWSASGPRRCRRASAAAPFERCAWSLQMPRFKPLRLMSESKSVIGLNMLTLWDERGSLDDLIEPLRGWVEDGSLRPGGRRGVPARRRRRGAPLHARARNVGKVVLTL